MNPTFTIFRREADGTLTEVVSSDDRARAEAIMERMKKLFPAEYEVRESGPETPEGAKPDGGW